MKERHLFLIWSEARPKRDEIINDLEKNLDLIYAETVRWSPQLFAENLSRLYGQSLPDNSFKQKHCGTGDITLLIVDDYNPKYQLHDIGSGRGKVLLNSNIYNLKQKYRCWTGGGHKIHATNDLQESEHDILLLCHKYPEDFKKSDINVDAVYERDLLGANGFDDLSTFQSALKICADYVILRGAIDEDLYLGREDLDVLVMNKDDFIYTLNLKHQGKKFSISRYQAKVKERFIHIDINFVGDNSFDLKWQNKMLQDRVLSEDGLYYLDLLNQEISDTYHQIIHKNVSDESSIVFIENLKIEYGYEITEPDDLMVEYHGERFNGKKPSFKRRVFPYYRDLRYAINKIKTALVS